MTMEALINQSMRTLRRLILWARPARPWALAEPGSQAGGPAIDPSRMIGAGQDTALAEQEVQSVRAFASDHPGGTSEREDTFRVDWRTVAIPTFHLQRFAAEDEGRTEEPTERRLREERDKGNVPKSADVTSSAVLIGTVITMFFLAQYLFMQAREIFTVYLSMDMSQFYNMGVADARVFLFKMVWDTGKIVGPVMIVAMVMGIIGGVSQVGAMFTLRALEFKIERIQPDFKRIIPGTRTAYSLGRIIVQIVVIGAAAYFIIIDDYIPMLKASGTDLTVAVGLFAWSSFKLLLIAAIILFALAIPDYYYQRYEYMENLKMNISEVKRERREEEGDPLVRQRQRERGMELRNQRNMLGEVPSADVVITNPTHYSVALLYDQNQSSAPVVVAKGKDHMAFEIRTIARQNGVPLQENPVLARVLYDEVDVGDMIPETMYQVVSLVFAKLDRFQQQAANA